MRMTKEQAETLLGIPDRTTYTVEKIDVLYRRAMLEVHPDTAPPAGLTGDTRTVSGLQQARKTLHEAIAGRNSPCAQCFGRGRVPHGIGTAVCGACKGTGDKIP